MSVVPVIDSSPLYGSYDKGELTVSPLLNDLTEKFFNVLYQNESCVLFVNQKKVLLQQIYKNLALEVGKRVPLKTSYLHELSAGDFTNYLSPTFKEPTSVLVILTRKHNLTELRVLEELSKTQIPVNVITLGISYYNPKFNVISVRDIKSLYWFLYAYLNTTGVRTFSEFSLRFVFSPVRVDFNSKI